MLPHAVTLTFDPLTLKIHDRWRLMCSIYVQNLSEIDHCAAELLTINDRFFVRFWGCSKLSIGDSKNAWPDLHQIWR